MVHFTIKIHAAKLKGFPITALPRSSHSIPHHNIFTESLIHHYEKSLTT